VDELLILLENTAHKYPENGWRKFRIRDVTCTGYTCYQDVNEWSLSNLTCLLAITKYSVETIISVTLQSL